jgi:hypothetical protein
MFKLQKSFVSQEVHTDNANDEKRNDRGGYTAQESCGFLYFSFYEIFYFLHFKIP